MTRDFEQSIKRWHNIMVWWPTHLFWVVLIALFALNRKMVIPVLVPCAGKADCVNRTASEVFYHIFNPAILIFFGFLLMVQIYTLTKSQDILELVVQVREAWEDLRS
ncbi:MAG: hypothetical protein MRY81_13080 [Donghicola eburneus]|nr:hypothetical protein [Donghicola eburneus]MAY34388.1 hypothetical protein [Rhodovulum sp.]MCI5040605.1 hypothetical protein [Donghicola eburneus]